jgi:hypothetical protein
MWRNKFEIQHTEELREYETEGVTESRENKRKSEHAY